MPAKLSIPDQSFFDYPVSYAFANYESLVTGGQYLPDIDPPPRDYWDVIRQRDRETNAPVRIRRPLAPRTTWVKPSAPSPKPKENKPKLKWAAL